MTSLYAQGLPENRTLLNGPTVEFAVVGETHAVASVYIFHELVHIGVLDSFFGRLPEKFDHRSSTSLLLVTFSITYSRIKLSFT
jgi:hypothetical protein